MASKVLVTGASGQDGLLLCQYLIRMGCDVVGIVRPDSLSKAHPFLKGVQIVEADLSMPQDYLSLMLKHMPDQVFHLAATHHSSEQKIISKQREIHKCMISTNFSALESIAFAILEAKLDAHLIYPASSQMYAACKYDLCVDESTPRNPNTFYGEIKSWSMDLLTHLRKEFGLRASSCILFNHESHLRGSNFVTKKIAIAAAKARCGIPNKLELMNIGARVDWSGADDVVVAMAMVAKSRMPLDYVISSGHLNSVQDLLEIAFDHAGVRWQECVTYESNFYTPALYGNSNLIYQTLGWRPNNSIRKIIIDMVDRETANISSY